MYHDNSRRHGESGLEEWLKAICERCVRCSDGRVHVLLRREGRMINQKGTRRICQELRLQVGQEAPRRSSTFTLPT